MTELAPYEPTPDVVTRVSMWAVKGLQESTVDGALPDRLQATDMGFVANGVTDREFVMDYGGWAVTQRGRKPGSDKVAFKEDRGLASVQTDIRPDHIAITAPGFGTFELGTKLPEDGEPRTVLIHGNEFHGVVRPEITEFLFRVVGREVAMVQAAPGRPRLISELYRNPVSKNQVAAADGYPYTLGSLASILRLAMLNGLLHIDPELTMDRYRANIVMRGNTVEDAVRTRIRSVNPHQLGEDYLNGILTGNFSAEAAKPNGRCSVPNGNQQTGVVDGLSGKLLVGRKGHVLLPDGSVQEDRFLCANLRPNRIADNTRVGVGDTLQFSLRPEPAVQLISRERAH